MEAGEVSGAATELAAVALPQRDGLGTERAASVSRRGELLGRQAPNAQPPGGRRDGSAASRVEAAAGERRAALRAGMHPSGNGAEQGPDQVTD